VAVAQAWLTLLIRIPDQDKINGRKCDKTLEKVAWAKHQESTEWKDLLDLATPNQYLRWVVATLNRIASGKRAYSAQVGLLPFGFRHLEVALLQVALISPLPVAKILLDQDKSSKRRSFGQGFARRSLFVLASHFAILGQAWE
jgi:hypothetical protein